MTLTVYNMDTTHNNKEEWAKQEADVLQDDGMICELTQLDNKISAASVNGQSFTENNEERDNESYLYQLDTMDNEIGGVVVKSLESINKSHQTDNDEKTPRSQWVLMAAAIFTRGYRGFLGGAFGVYYAQFLVYFDVTRGHSQLDDVIRNRYFHWLSVCSYFHNYIYYTLFAVCRYTSYPYVAFILLKVTVLDMA